jgi:hypothetical protein
LLMPYNRWAKASLWFLLRKTKRGLGVRVKGFSRKPKKARYIRNYLLILSHHQKIKREKYSNHGISSGIKPFEAVE